MATTVSSNKNSTLISGTSGDDSIYNGGDSVTIDGGTGNDDIENHGNRVTINGGKGDDSIYNVYGNNVTIAGDAGNDFIDNLRGNNVTIDGGTGNDVITNSGKNVLVQYSSGDGNDVIYGFRADSSLQINGGTGTYSTQQSGSDIIVMVGDGNITLKGAANLSSVNIIGEEGNFVTNVLTLDKDGTLNLTTKPSTSDYVALVIGRTDGKPDLAKDVATVSYDGEKYTLTSGSHAADIKSVTLNTVKNLTTDIETLVTTPKSGTFTINGKEFTAKSALTIATTEYHATLAKGTVSLSTGESVSTDDETISSTSGTITVAVGDAVVIGALNAGDAFTVDDESYTMTSIGLSDGTALREIGTSVSTDELKDNNWSTIVEVTDALLTLDNNVADGSVVADLNDPAKSINYGTLAKAGNNYTFTASGADEFKNITLNGIKATFPATNAKITAGNATFTATAEDNFTVDATGSAPTIINATAINLTAGVVNSTLDVPVTVNSWKITATNGNMTVGLVDGKATVSALNTGDTFTFDSTTYEMTAAGLYDATNAQVVIKGVSSDLTTFTVEDAMFGNVLTLDKDGTLNLTTRPSASYYVALVIGRTDGKPDLAKDVATVSYDGEKYTLTPCGNVDDLKSISLNAVKNLTTEIETNITTPKSGTFNINDKQFVAKSALTIATAKDNATLAKGTVSLSTGESVSTDDETISSTSGTITVAVGDAVVIGALNAGDAFKLGKTTYQVTSIGLTNGELVREIGTSITAEELRGDGWQTIKQAVGGALTIDSSTGTDLMVVDTETDPSKVIKYGTLAKAGNAYTFTATGSDSLKTITLDGVKATFPATNAKITAGNATFTATAEDNFTVDATGSVPTISNVTAINVTEGIINAPANIPVTVNSRKITATNGNMTVGLVDGKVAVGALNTGDTFTVDSTTYEMTATGLYDATNARIVIGGVSSDLTTFTVDDVALCTDGADSIDNVLAGATINALGGNDTITNSVTKVSIVSGKGNDSVNNTASKVTIGGDAGKDTIINSGASVKVDGGADNDTISNSGAKVSIYGGTGNDRINNSGASVSISGGTGNDSIKNTADKVTISAGTGNDTITNSGDNVLIKYSSGDGNDLITGFNATSSLKIGNGKATYNTEKVGEDVIVTVGDGQITLQGAASLWVDTVYGGLSDIAGTFQAPILILNDTSASPVTISEKIETVDASARKKAVKITGNALDNSIVGGSGKDSLYGADGSDTLDGGANNDKLYGQAGDDSLCGGSGNDYLSGAEGEDTLWGGAGNDTLIGGADADVFVYSGGKDVINDYVSGEDFISLGAAYSNASISGNDVVLTVGKGKLTIKNAKYQAITFLDGEEDYHIECPGVLTADDTTKTPLTIGADVEFVDATTRTKDFKATGNELNNTILGGSGKDSLYGGKGTDSLLGGKGNDKLYGQDGEDTLWGGAGNDTLTGGADDDLFIYSGGKDVIADYVSGEDVISLSAAYTKASISGNDVILTIKKNNTLRIKNAKYEEITFIDAKGEEYTETFGGGKLDDNSESKHTLAKGVEFVDATSRNKAIEITGNELNNTILGGAGRDTIYGMVGADYLDGGNNDDKLYGGDGDDTLIGGLGNDKLWGGNGADTFVYNDGDGKDTIYDFQSNDMLQITGAEFYAYYIGSYISIDVGDTYEAITFSAGSITTNIKINGDTYVYDPDKGSRLVKR